ncbi:hypothetical protein HPB50_019461 [Hyalomma asiaticum]|uniref:Uncharacterized protein n=1 Tax=Hyalomma asiaticum TaxID=266040 RepID=A0ACB7SHG0_HYAAI|nr:hypothetical protein HPB50_019461 [Hyalomma asiaticum]
MPVTAHPTFFRFISFETRAPNLRQTVPQGDAASVRLVRSTPGKQRRDARVAVASVSTVRARLIRATEAANVRDTEPSDENYIAPSVSTAVVSRTPNLGPDFDENVHLVLEKSKLADDFYSLDTNDCPDSG